MYISRANIYLALNYIHKYKQIKNAELPPIESVADQLEHEHTRRLPQNYPAARIVVISEFHQSLHQQFVSTYLIWKNEKSLNKNIWRKDIIFVRFTLGVSAEKYICIFLLAVDPVVTTKHGNGRDFQAPPSEIQARPGSRLYVDNSDVEIPIPEFRNSGIFRVFGSFRIPIPSSENQNSIFYITGR